MADGVWKVFYPKFFGRSRHLLLNKFFDLISLSMRKVDKGKKEKKRKEKEKITTKIVATNVIAS